MNKDRKFPFIVFCCLLLTAHCMLFFASKASGEIVGEIEVNGLYSINRDELLYLLDIDPGEKIDEKGVRLGIKRAFLKGLFEDISVDAIDGEKTKVIINAKERDHIKSISVEGDYALPKKTIIELFPLKEGQLWMCDRLEKAVTDLKRGIALRGFPRAGINAGIEKLKEPYSINIRLLVDTGQPEIIKRINISGDGETVKSLMKLSEGDAYDQSIFKKDIERIKTYYKGKDHFKPVVGPYTFADGILDIRVDPGKKLLISIEGNNAVSTKALLKDMPFFEVEDFSDDIVQEAVQKMSSTYYSKGYPFAQIAPVINSNDNTINLGFFIFEGVRVTIRSIKFIGASLPEKNLKEIMLMKEGSPYNPDIISTDEETLKDFYSALGYLSAKVEDFQTSPALPPLLKGPARPELAGEGQLGLPNEVDIIIKINEGLRTVIGIVNITGTKLVPEAEVRDAINIKPGDVYNDVDISDARFRVIDLYDTYGLIEAAVIVHREIANQRASLTFQINEGTEIMFGKAIVNGNSKTKYMVIKRELQQKEDSPFNYRILTKERQKLYKLGLFKDVEMEALDTYDHKKDVLIKLREGNAGAVELSLGYAEYEKYRRILDLSYRNLWGLNRQASLRFELSSLEKRYVLQYYEPWAMGIPLEFRAFVLGEDKKEINIDTRETRYRLTRYTATAGFEKKFAEALRSELYYEFSLVNTFDVQPDVILSREDTGTLVISGLRLGVIYDTRDNPFYPSRGILSGMSVKFTSPVFLSETDFIKLMFYGNIYRELTKGLVLAASLRGGIAQGYLKTQELPIVERFFLGGRTTVRGYEQDTLGPKGSDGNPTGGNVFLMENLELRISLGKALGIVTFLDGGNVWVKIADAKPWDLKFTTGLGLRYNTPVGPIRIDYGYKLRKEKGESSGALHFSIGHAF